MQASPSTRKQHKILLWQASTKTHQIHLLGTFSAPRMLRTLDFQLPIDIPAAVCTEIFESCFNSDFEQQLLQYEHYSVTLTRVFG